MAGWRSLRGCLIARRLGGGKREVGRTATQQTFQLFVCGRSCDAYDRGPRIFIRRYGPRLPWRWAGVKRSRPSLPARMMAESEGAGSDDVDCIRDYVCYLCPRVASGRLLSAYVIDAANMTAMNPPVQ
jgi:hypothetical protein